MIGAFEPEVHVALRGKYGIAQGGIPMVKRAWQLISKCFIAFGGFALFFMLAASGCRIFSPSGSSGIPAVQIINPEDGDTVSNAQEIIRVQINSSEETKKVRFFDNNLFLGEDYNAPFEHVWELAYVSNGQHELLAEVIDASGNTGRSTAISVFVTKEGLFDWAAVTSPAGDDLFAIYALDQQTGWACGSNGTMLKYEGSGWMREPLPSGVDEDLFDVFFINEDRGWSVGDNIMLAYGNGGWSTLASYTKKQLTSLFLFDASNGWVGDADGSIYWFDGDTITEYALLDSSGITDILGISQSNVWASCGSALFHFDGTLWTRDTVFSQEHVRALAGFGTVICGVGTAFFRYDGLGWEMSDLPTAVGVGNDIFLSAQTSGIICGEAQGKGFIFSFADSQWSEMSLQRDAPLYGLYGCLDGYDWAVGIDGTILRRTAQ